MQKEIISKNGYCIKCVEDPTDFYTNIEQFYHGLIEAVNIEFEDSNESDIKLLFGHNLECSERKAEEEVFFNMPNYEIVICSITNEFIYIFNIKLSNIGIWKNLKENIVKKFKNFNEFIQWLIPLIYDRQIYEEELTYFNHIYSKQNEKILTSLEYEDKDITVFIKHKQQFMYNHQLTDDEYDYLLNHNSVKVNSNFPSSLPNPVFIYDNDRKTLIKFKDYLKREHITIEQYWK